MPDNELPAQTDPVDEGQAQPDDVAAPAPAPKPPAPPRPAMSDPDVLDALKGAAANLVALNERIRVLEEEKAARARADEAAASEVWVHPNTHVLVLSNGTTVETANPSVTHHSDEDGTYPVISRHVINPE